MTLRGCASGGGSNCTTARSRVASEEGADKNGDDGADQRVDEVNNLVGHPRDASLDAGSDEALDVVRDKGGNDARHEGARVVEADGDGKGCEDDGADDAGGEALEADRAFGARGHRLQRRDQVGALAVGLADLARTRVCEFGRKRGGVTDKQRRRRQRHVDGADRAQGRRGCRAPHILRPARTTATLSDALGLLLSHLQLGHRGAAHKVKDARCPALPAERAPECDTEYPCTHKPAWCQNTLTKSCPDCGEAAVEHNCLHCCGCYGWRCSKRQDRLRCTSSVYHAG
mmetsp:Transcript_782/g.1554  ORF Transcript_782/g.1554 Transcript_782/m.1554 type:complete len:286 (-) Transcript_782:415-1272(-)